MKFAIRVANSKNETEKYIKVGSIDDLESTCEKHFPGFSRSVYGGLITGEIVPWGEKRYTLAQKVLYENDIGKGKGWLDKSNYRVYCEGGYSISENSLKSCRPIR